jgi:hypothetical protein
MTNSAAGKGPPAWVEMVFPVVRKNKVYHRYFRIAGISIRVESDLPIDDSTFAAKFKKFQRKRPDQEQVRIMHHFSLPGILPGELGPEVYRKAPWAICRKGSSWSYLGIRPGRKTHAVYSLASFNEPHTLGHVYHIDSSIFSQGNLHSLTMFPTDQIWLARVLAKRQGFFLHAAGMKINGQGLLFDDRMIIRRWPAGFRVHGTWSHGDVPNVSAAEAPLRAILFLEKAKTNRLIPIEDPPEILKRILPLLIKPLVTADWWEKTLAVVEKLIGEVPAYRLQFDKSGKIKEIIRELVAANNNKNQPRRQSRLP